MDRVQRPNNDWLVLVFPSLGFFMILLDTTIVNIAIPAMISSLHASLDQILWVLNAYLLVYAVLLITAGRLPTAPRRSVPRRQGHHHRGGGRRARDQPLRPERSR